MPLPFTSLTLDATAPDPLWRQLYQQLDEMLLSGAVREGASLPPERELAETLGVSRSTVKRSYDQLRHNKRLGGRGRAGSVVQPAGGGAKAPAYAQLKDFAEEMRELGRLGTVTLQRCEVVSERHISSIFQRPSHALFLHTVRICEADGVPVARELAWYDLGAAPGMADWDGAGSAHQRLRGHCGLRLGAAEQSVEAVLSSAEESPAFGFAAPQPCLLIKRQVRDAGGALLEYVEGTYRGDAYAYRVTLAT